MAISTGAAILGGAGLNLLGGVMGANAQEDAANAAARASLFRPVNITSGIGTVTAGGTPGNVSFETQLSPELQAIRNQLMGIGAEGLNQFQTFDPMQAAGLFTGQLNTMAAPQEQQQRTQLENRLFKQGLLTSSAGADRFGELAQAQAMAQNQRNLMGYQYGTGEQERLFQNALGGVQGATTLDNLLAQQLNQSISAGGAQTSANMAGANFQFQAGMNRGDALSGFFSSLGNTAAQYAFQPQSPLFGWEQQYNFQGNMPFGPEAFGPQ